MLRMGVCQGPSQFSCNCDVADMAPVTICKTGIFYCMLPFDRNLLSTQKQMEMLGNTAGFSALFLCFKYISFTFLI